MIGILEIYKGYKLKTNGLTGERYHFRRNGTLYTAYKKSDGSTLVKATPEVFRTRINARLNAKGKDKGHSRYKW